MPGVQSVSKLNPKMKNGQFTFWQRIVDCVLRPMKIGCLTLTLPDGNILIYGNEDHDIRADIKVVNNDFFRKCVLFGDIGFGESYVDGDWETEDITKVIEWMIINVDTHPTLMSDKVKKSPVNIFKKFNQTASLLRKNTIKGSRENIHAHYDLGNDFYRLFLDSTMTYSSAYFKTEQDTLEEAQYQKYERLCQKLQLCSSDHLLEIGSGWGGFAFYAAKNFGCRVTAVTISEEQYKYVMTKIAEQGLENQVVIEFKDYRCLDGKFDKIVSIEMLEAVGHEFYQSYFQQCHRLLKPKGILALQVILSPDHRYDSFRNNMDWIQKYIFPGSLLPSFSIIQNNINKTGNLCLYDYKDITLHYAKTLNIWCQKFNNKLDDMKKLGLDDVFIRKWNYYWCYCEAAFKTRNISVAQLIYSRPNNEDLRI